jgi:hypothetical protein
MEKEKGAGVVRAVGDWQLLRSSITEWGRLTKGLKGDVGR